MKKKRSSDHFHTFLPFHFRFSTFLFSVFTIFLLFFSIFPFFLASLFPVGQQKFSGEKHQGVLFHLVTCPYQEPRMFVRTENCLLDSWPVSNLFFFFFLSWRLLRLQTHTDDSWNTWSPDFSVFGCSDELVKVEANPASDVPCPYRSYSLFTYNHLFVPAWLFARLPFLPRAHTTNVCENRIL